MAATALVAAPAAGLFAGAALFIGLEHPARATCGPEIAVTESPPRDRRAAPMQATSAAIATRTGLGRSLEAGPRGWLVAGRLIGAVMPFALLVIRPTNARLREEVAHRAPSALGELLTRCGRLPAVRSAGVAFVPVLARLAHR